MHLSEHPPIHYALLTLLVNQYRAAEIHCPVLMSFARPCTLWHSEAEPCIQIDVVIPGEPVDRIQQILRQPHDL